MTNGKTAWCHFTAATKLFPLPRALGHKAILVSHFVFDRALQAPLATMLAQRQGLYYEVMKGVVEDEDDLAMQEQLHWQ
eukprot:13040933-Alexandrium_andersonii.AAC.1